MTDAPFTCHTEVKPEWIDYNGHMNMGYYLVAFDHIGTDRYFDWLGIGADHLTTHGNSTFTLGSNIDFIREVMEGDKLRITTQLVDYDHKRLHYMHSMYNEGTGELASINECLTMYVDMSTRRSTTWSDELMAKFAAEQERGNALGKPEGFGRTLGIRR